MKKYLLVLVGLCCVLSYALAERPDYPELKKSDEAHKTIKGKTYHGLVYAATDEKGERTGVAIKSSKIGKSVGYEALQKKFVKSKQ